MKIKHTETRLERIFQKKVYAWPEVHRKEEFGRRAYKAKSQIFAYFSEDGFALDLYRLTSGERHELEDRFGAKPHFSRLWWSIPLTEENLPELMPYVRRAYERSLEATNYSE